MKELNNLAVRISRPDAFSKKIVYKNFAKFTGKHLCWSFIFKKEAPTDIFSSDISEIFKNIFFIEHLRVTASEQ